MYAETQSQMERRRQAFTYHPPQGNQAERYQAIRAAAEQFAVLLNTHCPPSRELDLAQTNLEQAVMLANAAIARNEPFPPPPPPPPPPAQ